MKRDLVTVTPGATLEEAARLLQAHRIHHLPVVGEGNVIHLPDTSLEVAEACSGITSLVTLTPLAIVLAYFTEPTLVRRLVIIFAVVPAAMLGNLLRVIVTVWAAQRYGAEAATGSWLHESAGALTFALACLALIGLGALMRRFLPARA